ncbi:antibiotic biosynthesis monooxygenase family protein [Novosphingobium malaysiense]|uniref:Antibiotic biosynthesis monooxygenase n=1 Tax=Novosphingobium malaysiense TaxID=1348853 RepID=A0A0B1ZSY4_9SPHN|nr:antibiotic biosynthesis monooxygenase family protein [Novosphingobium malaysiense]KHK92227.1 antibiotic biosynthesis monooxygenase [Novosphingobium malaysiense]
MLLEIAEIEVRPGAEDQFAAAMRETGIPHLAACEGVVSVRFGRGVENPSKFTFNVVWTSMEAHTAARDLEDFGKFRMAFGDLTSGGAMSHYVMDEAVAGASA